MDEDEEEDFYYEPIDDFEARAMEDRMRRLREPILSIYQEIS